MKRYNQILDRNLDGIDQAKMYVTEFGEWVKWEDVKIITNPECNCTHHLYASKPSYPFVASSWICPAHGYKRR